MSELFRDACRRAGVKPPAPLSLSGSGQDEGQLRQAEALVQKAMEGVNRARAALKQCVRKVNAGTLSDLKNAMKKLDAADVAIQDVEAGIDEALMDLDE